MFLLLGVLLLITSLADSQDNALRKVAPALRDCYTDPFLLIQDNLLPHNIETFISLINKIENSPGFNQGITQLTTSLLYRFRQDGIIRSRENTKSNILPYVASTYHLGKHEALLKKLLPGNKFPFPDEILSPVEKCTLHSMMSITVNYRTRGDESHVCNQLANYRMERHPRSLYTRIKSNLNTPQNETNFHDFEDYENILKDYDDQIDISALNNVDKSECPVEKGVLKTQWGSVSIGNVINGIATGLQNQDVSLNILRQAKKGNFKVNNDKIDSRWASTLAGDLSEVVLGQAGENIVVGASGAWNNSILPKWYFISKREDYEMTDAEIRGDIDGILIALNVKEWLLNSPGLKLSQVLNMYYSHVGVLSSGIRACDRVKHFNEFVNTEKLKTQTALFSKMLNDFIGTVTFTNDSEYFVYAEQAVNQLIKYVPESLNDISCESTAPKPDDAETDIAADLIVFIDSAWSFNEVNSIIGYIVTQLNLHRKISTFTLFDAKDVNIVVNKTQDFSYIFQCWNETVHKSRNEGLDLPKIILTLTNMTKEMMEEEKQNSFGGGKSLIGLIFPFSSSLNEAEASFTSDKIEKMIEEVPDIRLLFFTKNNAVQFERFVGNKDKDIISTMNVEKPFEAANKLANRIKELSRRIVNPKCGTTWNENDVGNSIINDCITPGSIKYYKLSPNYFFVENSERKLRIQTKEGTGLIKVCLSRDKENPKTNSNNEENGSECQQGNAKEFLFDLANPCEGSYKISDCKPFFLSIKADLEKLDLDGKTTESECNNPYDIPFVVNTDKLTCHNKAKIIRANVIMIIFPVLIYYIRFLKCKVF